MDAKLLVNPVYNLSNLGRNLVSASHYRLLRQRAFSSWDSVTAA